MEHRFETRFVDFLQSLFYPTYCLLKFTFLGPRKGRALGINNHFSWVPAQSWAHSLYTPHRPLAHRVLLPSATSLSPACPCSDSVYRSDGATHGPNQSQDLPLLDTQRSWKKLDLISFQNLSLSSIPEPRPWVSFLSGSAWHLALPVKEESISGARVQAHHTDLTEAFSSWAL